LQLLARIRNSAFLRNNAVFFAGSLAVGALNYLYYPAMGRLLDTTSFGETQTLISLFLQAAILLSVMGLVAINVVANHRSDIERNRIVVEFEKLSFILSLGLLILTVVFGKVIANFFNFKDTLPFLLLILGLCASVPLTFRGAYLRGKQRFGLASGTNLISAGGKLLLALILVYLGFGTAGAIGGLVIAQVLASGLAWWWAAKQGLKVPNNKVLSLPNFKLLKPELKYGGLVLVGSLIIVMQYSVDVIVVKHYFDAHTAGLYAGVATVARILFFVTASIALVLMPMVKITNSNTENRRILIKSLLLFTLVALPIVIIFIVLPEHAMLLLMGPNYSEVASLLPALGTAIFIVSALNVVVSYHLALRRYGLAAAMILGSFATYWLMFTQHQTLNNVVNNLLIGSAVMLSTVMLWTAISTTKKGINNIYAPKVDFDNSPGAQRSAQSKTAAQGTVPQS
jgi:O-antigen/teichoic acid export membrane protein